MVYILAWFQSWVCFLFFFTSIQICTFHLCCALSLCVTDHSPLAPADKTSVKYACHSFFARQSKPTCSHPWTNSDFCLSWLLFESQKIWIQYSMVVELDADWLNEWVTVLHIEAVSYQCFLLALNSYVLFLILLATGSHLWQTSTATFFNKSWAWPCPKQIIQCTASVLS